MTPHEAAFLLAVKHIPNPDRQRAITRYHRFLPDCHRQHKLNHKKLQELAEKYNALESKVQAHIQSQHNTRTDGHLAACRKAKAEINTYKVEPQRTSCACYCSCCLASTPQHKSHSR